MGEAAGPTHLLWLLCVTVLKASDMMQPNETPLGHTTKRVLRPVPWGWKTLANLRLIWAHFLI